MKTIIVLGDINVDIILSGIQSPPVMGREILAEKHLMKAGGSAANAASMLALNGCPVQLFGCVGNDFNGKYAIKSLRRFGVKTDTISLASSESTGITISLTYPHERMYISYPGTVALAKLEDFKKGYLCKDAHLHLSSFFLQENLKPSVGNLLKQAKENGMTTSLDPGGDPSEQWDISGLKPYLKYLDWFMPNADEIKAITKVEDIEYAIQLCSREITGIVVKMGSKGAITCYEGKIKHWPGFDVDAIDTTCAGDCFNAGFLYSLMNGDSLAEAVRRGNKYGAESVLNVGLPHQKIK